MIAAALLLLCAGAGAFVLVVRLKQMHLWLPSYLGGLLKPEPAVAGPLHIIVCVCDHFEPQLNRPPYERECERVDTWLKEYPLQAARHRDADGFPPQHTFFYPEEEYRREHLDKVARICQAGFGDVEIHLHHDNDTAEGLREKLTRFKKTLHEQHGLLRRNPESGEIEYAFIHGNWALDNCAAGGHWCGVNNELIVLRETGCYADLTFPSAPSETQTAKINSIYYATDDPERPKSHDDGVDLKVGAKREGDLLLIQGPLALNWRSRKLGLMPRIENGELTGSNPPTPGRADLWVRQHIHVAGRPEWVFVKLHTHGANEENSNVLFGGAFEAMWSDLERRYNDGAHYALHYVTARQMYNMIEAARAGASGNPGDYREFSPAQKEGTRVGR